MDALFAEAERARAADARPFDADDVSLAAARQVHAAWRQLGDDATHVASLARCSSACTRTRRYELRLYACDDDRRASVAFETADGRRVHACVDAALCVARGAHGRERTAELRRAGVVDSLDWCAEHARMHACARCTLGELDSLGMRVCVLSGRRLNDALTHAFGEGVSSLHGDAQRRADADGARRRAERSRRALEPSVADRLLDASAKRAHASDDADCDFPSPTLFPHHVDDNTFATGIEANLAQFYASAYHTVHRLIFSAERGALEAAKEQRVRAAADKRVARYIRTQRREREPIVLGVCQQYVDHVYSQRHLYDLHLVAAETTRRLTAYWALVSMEFYVQLNAVADRVRESSPPKKVRESADRLATWPIEHALANVLDVMASGFAHTGRTIVPRERWLELYPESLTIKALGIAQGTCTSIKKDVYAVLNRAIECGVPLELVQTTSLESERVMFKLAADDASVVTMFLRARKQRLGM